MTIIHTGLVGVLLALVFSTDFLTPPGFAHGILYVPVLIFAMVLTGVNTRFRQGVLVATLGGIALDYALTVNRSSLPEVYIISNSLLSAGMLLLTYGYFHKLHALNQKNSEITRLEKYQRQSLHDFIDAMPVQVWAANTDGEVDFVGHNLELFTGKSKDTILDDWLALLHPDDRADTMAKWTYSVQTGAPYQVDFRVQRHDGEYIWFKARAVAQRDEQGQLQRWLGSSIDIDDLRRLREESDRLAARYRQTLESITNAFFTLDHDFRFTYLNQKAADMMGSGIDDFLGKVIWEGCCIGYDGPFAVRYRRAAQTQQTLHFEEYFAPGDKWLEVHVYPSAEGLTVYFSDISERREMEQRLRESQKMEAVGHLTGGVAHDFNNLLTVILGNAEMLTELATDPKLRSMAEMTVSAAKRGAQLTNRLLAFARRQPLDPKPTDINRLTEAMRTLIRRTLPENIELEIVPAHDLGIAEIDAGELDTALLNLVVNARDAMPDGGKLTIETANVVLDSHYAARTPDLVAGEYVMVAVSDTGVGMTPETVRRAFEPFFTTKEAGRGCGLGLSMVFGFTRQSGGHVNIYSEQGEGTIVKLYFPRVQHGRQSDVEVEARSPVQRGSEHILIVEDEALVLQHLEGQLRSLGYRVTAVTSGAEALAALQAHSNIDLLLTDIIMPGGMNGRQLADQAKTGNPALKVLYTSGYSENAIVHQGRLDPGVELLSKPYTRLELASKVRKVLDKANPGLTEIA